MPSRFRDKSRDIETDLRRVLPLRQALAKALEDAEKERRGLSGRVEDARVTAAFLFGDEVHSEAGEDGVAAEQLGRVERVLSRGEVRLHRLDRQIAALSRIGHLLDSMDGRDEADS